MDKIAKEVRSRIMQSIKSKNTKPEILVRKLLTKYGYRYRLHSKDLPGKPDIVFRKKKKVIFINGCFWHGHICLGGRVPSGEYWQLKMAKNLNRDIQNVEKLKADDWKVLVIWECELKDLENIEMKIRDFLEN